MMVSRSELEIYRADIDDKDAVTQTLADTFYGGDLAGWLIPDPDERRRVYPDYFRIFAEWFLVHGHVDVTAERDAVALWMPVGDRLVMDIADYDERLAKVCGTAIGRFVLLDAATDAHHPTGRPHEYLAFLAVAPARQGHGLGGALLRHRLNVLDRANTAAYLEATGDRNRRLYARHGFRATYQAPIIGGPSLYPMWRQRAPHA